MVHSAAVVAARWRDNLVRSQDKIRAGVEAVTENPMEKAAAAKDKWVQGVQDAANNGAYERGLRNVSLTDWRDAILNKGLQRLSSGATQALPKMQAFLSEFLPFAEQVSQTVQALPSNTFEDRIARMVRNAQMLHEFRRTR